MEYLKINITELENYPSNSLDNCFDIMHPLIRNLLLMIFASPPLQSFEYFERSREANQKYDCCCFTI